MYALDGHPFSSLRLSPLDNLLAVFSSRALQKTVRFGSFFLFGVISKAHSFLIITREGEIGKRIFIFRPSEVII